MKNYVNVTDPQHWLPGLPKRLKIPSLIVYTLWPMHYRTRYEGLGGGGGKGAEKGGRPRLDNWQLGRFLSINEVLVCRRGPVKYEPNQLF